MHGQENTLERFLQLAALEPAHRPEFWRVLLTSSVYVLGSSDVPPGSTTLNAGAKLSIQNWTKPDGTPVIPFFSSLNALTRAIEKQEGYVFLPAKSLFEITRGATLVLNPRSEYGREFGPDEIDALVNEGLGQCPIHRAVEKPTQVLLGQPRQFPTAMANSLTTLLIKHPSVRAAYVALMHDPSIDDKPHLVVGIQGEGDVEKVIREAGVVAAETSPNGEQVDLVKVVPGQEGLSKYFIEKVQPFYSQT